MSRRFGRNQRRRMREALAQAETMRANEQAGRLMAEGLMMETSRKLANLREHMAGFVARVGRYAIAAEPQNYAADFLGQVPNFRMAVPPRLDAFSLDSFLSTASDMTTAVFCAEVMHVLDISAVRDPMSRDMHCRLYFDDHRIGYAISAHAIAHMTADEITSLIAPEIAWALVKQIKGPR